MEKNELLEKIERQSGYIDHIDAFRLISAFTDEFGVVYTTLQPEDELRWMFLKLKGYNIRTVQFEKPEKECIKCKETKNIDDFAKNIATKDGRNSSCRLCNSKTGKLRDIAAIELERDLIKVCKRCKVEKRHFEYQKYSYKGERCRKPNCLKCEAEMKVLIENRKNQTV